MQVETVKVVVPANDDNPQGYIVINKSDMTEEHELFKEGEEGDETKKAKKLWE